MSEKIQTNHVIVGFTENANGSMLTIGRKIFGTDKVDLVNAIIGEEAKELWNKLTVPVAKDGE